MSAGALEKYFVLFESASSAGGIEGAIRQALTDPKVLVFGELLDHDGMKHVAASKWKKALELFAFGTYSDYKAKAGEMPDLTGRQISKLKQLSIVTMAQSSRELSYDQLSKDLDLKDSDEVEELVLKAKYTGVLDAELDYEKSLVIVKSAIGRDVQPSDLDELIGKFEALDGGAAAMEGALRAAVRSADVDEKASATKVREFMDKVARELNVKQSKGKKGSGAATGAGAASGGS